MTDFLYVDALIAELNKAGADLEAVQAIRRIVAERDAAQAELERLRYDLREAEIRAHNHDAAHATYLDVLADRDAARAEGEGLRSSWKVAAAERDEAIRRHKEALSALAAREALLRECRRRLVFPADEDLIDRIEADLGQK